MFKDEPVVLTLTTNGAGTVTADNIVASSDVEIVNPEQHVATITDKNRT